MRGRPLLYHGDPITRPMKDRVREAVFNLVGPSVKDRLVFDVFAGTGALGLEAISRGARRAVFIERHFPTIRIIEKNAESLGVAEKTKVVAGDTFHWCQEDSELWDRQQDAEQPWLVLVSPPYDFFVSRCEEMMALVALFQKLAPSGSLLVVESDARFDPSQLPDPESWDVRTYSPAQVAISETK